MDNATVQTDMDAAARTGCPEGKNTAAQVTVLTSEKPQILTKMIRMDKEGCLLKVPSAQLVKGHAAVTTICCLEDFSALLQGLNDNQALVYGVPKENLSEAKVVTKKAFEKRADTTGVITRSNQHFDWPKTPGIMMFDYDPDQEVLSKEAVLQLLCNVCPQIKDVDHLWWTSSSSNISNTETEEEIAGVTGQRIYLMVADASDIPRAAKNIEHRLWLAGHGVFKVTSSGALLERTPFDMMVYQPSRLDFAAGASCDPPLRQSRGAPDLIRGSARMLDTKQSLPDLDAGDLETVKNNKFYHRATQESDAEKVRARHVEKYSAKLRKTDPELNEKELTEIFKALTENKTLDPSWPLEVLDGNQVLEVTVEAVLADKYRYHGQLCRDPIEPDYDDGRFVGKLYLLQDRPCLHSFARGGQSYWLEGSHCLIPLHARLHDATNETLHFLEPKQEVFSYGGSLAAPIDNKLVSLDQTKMKYLLSGCVVYLGANRKPCDPTKDLAESVLQIGSAKNINPVTGFVDHPIIDAKFRSLTKPGYDRKMKILGGFDPVEFDVVDKKLTKDKVLFHLDRIFAPFTGFDLSGPDDKTILMAAIFSGVLRQVLPTCPAFGFDAPMQGSGKTLLAETIAIIASGSKASAQAPGRSDYDDEFRKRLFSLLLKGEKVIFFDNIVGEFDSPSFAAALTSEFYEDRILQHSKTAKVLNKTLFLITGNNLRFTGDMTRRVLKVRLKPKDDKLANRTYAFDPLDKALETRCDIISSVLTLINHWQQSGRQKQPGTMTSFTEWDTLVRQPLAFLARQHPETELRDILDVFSRQQEDSSDKVALIALLTEIANRFGEGEPFKAGAAHKIVRLADNQLSDAVFAFASREKLQSSQHLGNLLKQFVDRNVEGLVLRSKKASGSQSYWVELTDDTHRHSIKKTAFPQHAQAANDDAIAC